MAPMPATVDLTAYRGDTWAQTFRLLEADAPLDLAGATVASWVRKFDGSVEELVVTVNGTPGEVTISQPAGGLDCGSWKYDLEVDDPDGSVTTWVRGTLTVTPDVTNAPADD